MSAAKVASDGAVTVLDGRGEPDEAVTADDAKDASKLARLLGRLLSDVAALRRAWAPRSIDFEDVTVSTAGAQVALAHNFGGRVRWWICGWQSSGTSAPVLRESSSVTTDENTLYLQSYVAGTACIRVEEAG